MDKDMNCIPVSVCQVELDEKLTFTYKNEWFIQELEYTGKSELTEPVGLMDLIYHDDIWQMTSGIMTENKNVKTNFEVEVRINCGSGIVKWMNIKARFMENSGTHFAMMVLNDIDQRKGVEEKLAYHQSLLSNVFASYIVNLSEDSAECVGGIFSDEYRWMLDITRCNESYSTLVKHYSSEHVSSEYRFMYSFLMNPENVKEFYKEGRHSLQVEHKIVDKTGEELWAMTSVNLMEDSKAGDIKGVVCHQNIDRQKRDSFHLKYQAKKDELTGLYNRRAVIEEVKKTLYESGGDTCHAMMILDLDNFKMVNDTYGHQEGDRVLAETAAYLTSSLRKMDVVGRLGGDEFIFLMRDASNEAVVIQKLQTMCEGFQNLYKGIIAELPVSVSIGMCFFPFDGTSWETLYEKADLALYQAKSKGKNRVVCYGKNEFN